MVNAMPASARRGSFSESQGLAIIDAPRRLLVSLDQDIVRAALAQSALTLGMAHRLPAYHASYLEVALRRALRLAVSMNG
jgi:predicted nucleic acid-binding protein